MRAGTIEDDILKRSEKFISAAEDYAARNKPVPAAANLRALSKRLKGDQYDALRAAVAALAASYD